jgi:hypothetical protein
MGCTGSQGAEKMELLSKLLGRKKRHSEPPSQVKAAVKFPEKETIESEPTSEAQASVAEIDSIAAKHVNWEKGLIQISGGGDSGIWATEVLGKALRLMELDPTNLDYKFLEVCVLLAGLQFLTAEQRLRAMLAQHPGHLEGRCMLDHGQGWHHVFYLPRWDDQVQRVPGQIQATGVGAVSWHSVRIGVQRVVSAFLLPTVSDFRGPVTAKTRCKIEPVFSDTPSGPIVAMYVMIEDNPADPLKAETFLDPIPHPGNPSPWNSGNFLIQHLALQGFTYVVVAPAGRVEFNRKLAFDSDTSRKLNKVAEQVQGLKPAQSDSQAFKRAAQWHMQRFSLDHLRF